MKLWLWLKMKIKVMEMKWKLKNVEKSEIRNVQIENSRVEENEG